MKVVIFGLGLVGGSLGLALKGRGVGVIGVERTQMVDRAEVRAVADDVIDETDDARVRAAYGDSDLVVLAAPVSAIVLELPRAIASASAVTDAGSTKRTIAAAAKGAVNFVPGHPMAGGSDSGAEHARGDLFQGRRWVLCPEGRAPLALERTEAMVALVGAEIVHLEVEAHDRAVALTSHAPQLLASLLCVRSERRGTSSVIGTGFRTMTQTAGANPAIWRDILATNADFISEALAELGGEIASVVERLKLDDLEPALALIEEARRLRGGAGRGSR